MELISTPTLRYEEIEVNTTDIYDDAWGFNSEFSDVLEFLGSIDKTPADGMSDRLVSLLSGQI
ncbi:MAG TPA: hypothetical protein VMT63_07115 [Bacteroidales bacterium]|nr:hypothetical protein [Bacteroidales bacterium]